MRGALQGNLWKLQCKREKGIGPTRVKAIIKEGVDKNDPPFGYILVAPTTFSKKSYDVFRNELRAKGVMEFYLWGKAELEDMLFLPKNDSILFAFFGLSLITRRRIRASEIKFSINNKNKLLRILGDDDATRDLHESFLARDFKDVHYPWKNEYKNFDQAPRWKEYTAIGFHPLGLLVGVARHFAYVNIKRKEWDFVKGVNLLNQRSEELDDRKTDSEHREKVRRFCRFLPLANQVELFVRAIIFFEDMLIIDEKGDSQYPFPHMFVDFKAESGPFRWFYYSLRTDNQEIPLNDEYKKIEFFPEVFPATRKGKIYRDRVVQLDEETIRQWGTLSFVKSLFDVDGKYDFLNQRDIIRVAGVKPIVQGEDTFIEITYKYRISAKDYLDEHPGLGNRGQIEKQIGRKLNDSDELTVLEFESIYSRQLRDE